MADWQVDFYMVPRRALDAPGVLTASALIGGSWWSTYPLPSDYQRRLATVAPPLSVQSPGVESWGSIDGNRVDVHSAGGKVTSIVVRVDVRRLDSKFGAALLQFVRIANAVLVRSDGLVIEPIIGAYAAALRGSSAWKSANEAASLPPRFAVEEEDE